MMSKAQEIMKQDLAAKQAKERLSKWDKRYLLLALEVGKWSKDPSTKVGAILVRPNNSVASTGYNGFPPGADDSPGLYEDRRYKYANVIHAEVNALNFLSESGETPHEYTLYTSFPCCPACAERICEAGVGRIVTPPLNGYMKSQEWVKGWADSIRESAEIIAQHGVEWDIIDV